MMPERDKRSSEHARYRIVIGLAAKRKISCAVFGAFSRALIWAGDASGHPPVIRL